MSKNPSIDNTDNERLQDEYSKFCQFHVECLTENIINNQSIDKQEDITLIGLSEASSALVYSNLGSLLASSKESELSKKVLEIVEKEEDKIASLVLVSKLCTEMLSKIHLAQRMCRV